jgi:hypothetical protein
MMKSVDFEKQWLAKLSHCLMDIAGDDVEKEVMAGSEETLSGEDPEASVEWTRRAMECLDRLVSDRQKRDIMTGCACRYPESDLDDVKRAYGQSGDIDEAVGMLKDKFVSFLREGLELGEDHIEKILKAGWGLAGIREGDVIIAMKIPKSGSLVEYFKETDPERKRSLYCHCPRVRDSIGRKPEISKTYCYCGAGFYRAIWEYILDRPVEVEVLESVLGGADVCRIAIHLQRDE